MNILSKQEHKSAVIEGVTFKTRLVGPSLRARINLEISETRAKLADLERAIATCESQMQSLLDASEKDEATGLPKASSDINAATPAMLEIADKLVRLRDDRISLTRVSLAPAYFKHGLIEIDGLTMDGKPYNGDILCEYGPEDLFEEILATVYRQFYFSDAETKNSSSPTTSTKPEVGTATEPGSGTVSVAGSQEITSSGTAGNTSLSLVSAA